MASNTQAFPRMLKMLRENSNPKDKREALTYIRSNSKKLESMHAIKGEQYKELCKLVVDAFANGNNDVQNEAYETLNVIIKDFKDHSLNLFETVSRINKKNRLKILKLLEVVEDNAISLVAYDAYTVNCFNNCMCTVQTSTMPWLAATACTDSLQALVEAESKPLSDDQRLEEETINYCITLLRRLYKVAAITSDTKVHRFSELLLDKIILLAYMGHKRQRGPALKLLQQVLATDILSYVRNKLSNAWTQYKTALQTVYCKRMLLLVSACELDWATQWNISVLFLGMDLHRGAGLINNLLSVEEQAFKSTDSIIRRQAFLSWKLLVDNFALDSQELATARRIKLLCIPLNAKNSKTELIALTKLEVWWHVIVKLYKDISKFVNPVITQFLNFCFGPLGDTPLLSSKFDIVASPGKRFFKTKIVGVDALCQLLVTKQENHAIFSPMLEERLPHSISDAVFQECYKSIIHSVGEVLLVLSQLTDAEMKNRYQLGKILWTSLINYVQESKMEKKELMYKDVILVVVELINYCVDKPMVKHLTLQTILPKISDLSQNLDVYDDTLLQLVLKLMQAPILHEAEKKHYTALQQLLWQCIKSQNKNTYYSHALKSLKEVRETLYTLSSEKNKNESVIFELWCILAEVLTKYMCDLQEINEGTTTEHNFETVELIVKFPFMHICLLNQNQVNHLLKVWKPLYKKFEMRADSITTVKSNEVLLNIATAMQYCIVKNERSYCLIINCLDTLLSSIDYKSLLEHAEIPSVMHLTVELVVYCLTNKNNIECESVLKILSAILITIYGHDPQQVISYLEVCKPAVELLLTTELDTLQKEIANTWETIVTIFKGLNQLITYNLISSYKKAIIHALNHSNSDIVTMTWSFLEIKDSLSVNVKLILEEVEKEAEKCNTPNKSEITKKKKNDHNEKSSNQVKVVASVLNKKYVSPKPVCHEIKSAEQKISDSDSQDYVFIKTDFKFDVNRLTEHQKESLKRKRDDIPALYNDLSQSSSQDTQNLQEWFDKKNRTLEEKEKFHIKEVNTLVNNVLYDDANKENKVEIEGSEVIDKSVSENNTKSIEKVEQNVCIRKAKDDINNGSSLKENETSQTIDSKSESAVFATTADSNKDGLSTETVNENSGIRISDSSTEDFNVNSQKKCLDGTVNDQRLSPSVLDNGKRRNRLYNAKSNATPKSEEITNNHTEQSNTTHVVQKLHKRKVVQNKTKIGNKQKVSCNMENKLFNENKRGVKRKSASDSESDGSTSRRHKKINLSESVNDNDNIKSTESNNIAVNIESIIEDGNLSQRTKNEISRLRINMVFDSPLSNTRRSKTHEDNNKDVIPKKQSSENKSLKLKVADVKSGDYLKKLSKGNDKDLNGTSNLNKKGRGLTKSRSKGEKNSELNEIEDAQQVSQSEQIEFKKEKKIHENTTEKESKDTGINMKTLSNIECMLSDRKEANESNVVISRTDVLITETESIDCSLNGSIKTNDTVNTDEKLQTQNDTEEIIESSQVLTTRDKKCNEKQCFIKISKTVDTSNLMKCHEVVENVETSEIVLDNPENGSNEVQKENDKELAELGDTNDNDSNVLIPDSENNLCDNEKNVFQIQKVNEESLLGKCVIGFSSPKTNARRQLKFKPYSAQGRAAHMLGLVTKQGKVEFECHFTNTEDETVAKKQKSKDTDNEALLGKRKEVDKVTGTCSTRQEKIFSNMKSPDYCHSPPVKLFSNLKNDGEKAFPKSDKLADSVPMQSDVQVENVNEENLESEELQILEWSSANPPSLTASPSVSILKRHRLSIPEPDPESTTPNKRKRVSFADPPVSKEMGYEIATNCSPHKANKVALRGLLGRKDTPLKLKQVKQRLTNTDSEKLEKEEEEINLLNTSEVDLQCERENELLTKIAEQLEYSENIMHTEIEMLCMSEEKESINDTPVKVNVRNHFYINNLNTEFEITEESTFSKFTDSTSTNEVEHDKREASETTQSFIANQENADIHNSKMRNSSIGNINKNSNKDSVQNSFEQHNSSVTTYKIDITDDSVLNNSSEKQVHSEVLEDTIDAQNLTDFNSTANSDEIFCGRLMRTSTQAVDSIEEQDTLPVTDSVLGSLPLSQDSQNTSECNVEIPHPELLDSIQPIYPSLILCKEPIKSIIGQLTNPLWIQHLSVYFANRNLQTIGDLAQLSEREVNRIPVKGNSKIEFVKCVLKCFEKTYTAKETAELIFADEMSKVKTQIEQKKVENHETSIIQSKSDESQNLTALDVSLTSQKKLHDFFQDTERKSTASDSVTNSSNTKTTQVINVPVSSAEVTASTSKSIIGSNNGDIAQTTSTQRLVKTVGTCTSSDSVYLSKSVTNKVTKSVSAQMALEDLLDEIDVNLVLESAVRRCTPEKILLQYKNKMKHVPQVELERQTISLLGVENRKDCSEVALRTACRACGVNKVLLRLPDIFSADKQFFVKVLNTYRKKIKTSDCLKILDFAEIKDGICEKCTSSELAEMLSKKLKEEEQEGIKTPIAELSNLNRILKRVPMDVIISHTVANDELIPSHVVLDIALQNNTPSYIAQALESQSSLVTKNVFNKLWSPQFATEYIETSNESKEDLLKIFKAVSSKLSSQELLQAFYESMDMKVTTNKEKD